MTEHPFVAAIREQLARNAQERAFLESALAEARRFYQTQTEEPQTSPAISSAPRPKQQNRASRTAFGPQPGGPKETVIAIAQEQPGLPRVELKRLAVSRVTSAAKDPARSIDETLRVLMRSGKLIERDGGLYFPK